MNRKAKLKGAEGVCSLSQVWAGAGNEATGT